jgi:hypothetical protein
MAGKWSDGRARIEISAEKEKQNKAHQEIKNY